MAPATTTTTTTTTNNNSNNTTPINSQQANATTTSSAKKSNETTLTHLTKRFVKLLNTSSERVINLNEASTRLSVAKRRIYDITNVLEGIGLLQKTSKNVTRWVDCPRDSPFAAPMSNVNGMVVCHATDGGAPARGGIGGGGGDGGGGGGDGGGVGSCAANDFANLKAASQMNLSNGLPDSDLLALIKTYQSLEDGVNDLEAKIRQQLGAEGAYVTYHDIKSFFNDQIVIAVKAPPETRLEVNESLQIWMKSENGEIEVYLCPQYANNSSTQQQVQNGYQSNTSPHLQQSQISNSSNTQPLDATITNTNLVGQQQPYTAVSSDEGRGKSTISTTDGQYYDPTSGVSNDDHYYNDPTLSSALSGTISEDEDPFKPLVPFEAREETHYNFMLDDNYTITSLFPEDNLGLY